MHRTDNLAGFRYPKKYAGVGRWSSIGDATPNKNKYLIWEQRVSRFFVEDFRCGSDESRGLYTNVSVYTDLRKPVWWLKNVSSSNSVGLLKMSAAWYINDTSVSHVKRTNTNRVWDWWPQDVRRTWACWWIKHLSRWEPPFSDCLIPLTLHDYLHFSAGFANWLDNIIKLSDKATILLSYYVS